ncbi:hypothetical protein [Risungbinella massiliensis]|uniref:hypothetical protein n=1 Tax=Risungbinella massiliensis TaxID=1329796 RepID=UPI0005CC5B08|nr:hypothetical protein [Risungbinella massiliensis]
MWKIGHDFKNDLLKNHHELLLLFEKTQQLNKSKVFSIEDMIEFCIDSVDKEIRQSSLKLLILKDGKIALKTNQPLAFNELIFFYPRDISQGTPTELKIFHKNSFSYKSDSRANSTLISQTDIQDYSEKLEKKQDDYLLYYKLLIEAKKAVAEVRKTGQMTESNKLTLKKHAAETLYIFLLILEELASELKSTGDILQFIQREISIYSIVWVQQMAAGYCKDAKNVPRSFELNKPLARNHLTILNTKDNNSIGVNKEDLLDKITTMEQVNKKINTLFMTINQSNISKAQEYYTDFVLNGDFGLHSLDELFAM